MTTFCDLNDDCLREIFGNLDKNDIISLCEVSRGIKIVALEFIPKFTFDYEYDLKDILDKFERDDVIEIFSAIRRLVLNLSVNEYNTNKSYSLLTKNLKSLNDLKVVYDAEDWKSNYCARWNKSPTRTQSRMNFEFLRQVKDLKKISIVGLELDTETAEMFVHNNQTIEDVKIENCKGIKSITKLPQVHTLYYKDYDLDDGCHIEIGQMLSLKTLIYETPHSNYKIKEIVDQLAITNVIQHLYIFISEQYDPFRSEEEEEDDYFGEDLKQLELTAQMTNLKSFAFRNNTGLIIELNLIVRNLPELEYLENYCCSFLDVDQVIGWLRNCPLLKKIKCLDLLGENVDFVATETYLKIEDYLVVNNRSLTLCLEMYTDIPERLKNNPNFNYLKFRTGYDPSSPHEFE